MEERYFMLSGLHFNFSSSSVCTIFLSSFIFCKIILYPLKTKFRIVNFVSKHVLYGFSLLIALGTSMTIIAYKQKMSLTSLCSPFINVSNNNVVEKATILNVFCAQVLTGLVITVLYSLIARILMKNSEHLTKSTSTTDRNTSLCIILFLLVFGNCVVWLLSNTLYLLHSHYQNYFNLSIWTSLVISSLTAILNPVFFVLTSKSTKQVVIHNLSG